MKNQHVSKRSGPSAFHSHVLVHRLQFRPGVRRYSRSAFARRMRAFSHRSGLVTMSSRNWVICLPTAQQSIEQARTDVAWWLVDQPEVESFCSYLPALAMDVLRQRQELQLALDDWAARPRDIDPENAAPLLSTLCGYALSAALASQGGAQ